MNEGFGFKQLKVWQKALQFASDVIDVTENLKTDKKHYKLVEQAEGAVASIAQNIGEGKGRYSKKEFKQFLYYARGSMYEVITLLNLFDLRGWITKEQLDKLEEDGLEIVRMIKGLINSLN